MGTSSLSLSLPFALFHIILFSLGPPIVVNANNKIPLQSDQFHFPLRSLCRNYTIRKAIQLKHIHTMATANTMPFDKT